MAALDGLPYQRGCREAPVLTIAGVSLPSFQTAELTMAHWRSGKLPPEDDMTSPSRAQLSAEAKIAAQEQAHSAGRAAWIAAIAACIAAVSALVAAWMAYEAAQPW